MIDPNMRSLRQYVAVDEQNSANLGRKMRKFLLCVAQLLCLTTWAGAQSVAETVQDFRLIGVWAVNCQEAPVPGNEHSIFSKTDNGAVLLMNDFGAHYDTMLYRITAAVRMDDERISIRQVLTNDPTIVVDVVLLKVNDRIRTWSSRVSGGTTLVSDGIVDRSSGHQTKWLGRCKERWVSK
jgi:hypothetical protein